MAAGLVGEGLALALVTLNPGGSASLPAGQGPLVLAPAAAQIRRAVRQAQGELPRPAIQFATSDEWTPPAKTWGTPGQGPVIELGALGSKYSWQPDLVHLSLDWNF